MTKVNLRSRFYSHIYNARRTRRNLRQVRIGTASGDYGSAGRGLLVRGLRLDETQRRLLGGGAGKVCRYLEYIGVVADARSVLILNAGDVPEPTGAPTEGQDIYFEVLELQPIQLSVSFMRTDRVNADEKYAPPPALFFRLSD